MKLRFRLLLLAALVVLVVAGSVAAREETKPQDGGESTDVEADGEKSKKQKDEIQLDAGNVRVKQKWQKYKSPSSKKAKKTALRKQKSLTKSGKEKWKVVAEEVRDKRAKRSAQYVKRDTRAKQKWTKDKSWKDSKDKKSPQPSGECKKKKVDKLRQDSKVVEKQVRNNKQKSNQDSNVCKKDKLCYSSSDEKNKWKSKNSGVGMKEESVQLNEAGDENPNDGNESVVANGIMEAKSDEITGEGKQGDVLQQRTTKGNQQAAKPKGQKSAAVPAVQPDNPSKHKGAKVDKQGDPDGALEETGEQSTEDTGKNNSGNRKVKRSYIVEEEYDPECTSCSSGLMTDDAGETESSSRNTVGSLSEQSRIRRYIVEEEMIEDGALGEEEAIAGDEMPTLME